MISRGIQVSICEPPQELLMIPTGTPRLSASVLAKKYAGADIGATVSFEEVFHPSLGRVSTPVFFSTYSTLTRLSPPCSSSCVCTSVPGSSPRLSGLSMRYSMFDCPEASQTSPTSTSCSLTVVFPSEIVIVRGSKLASMGSSLSIHEPSSPTVVRTFCPANLTLTFLPGIPLPQMAAGSPCWRTMLSPITFGSSICAWALPQQNASSASMRVKSLPCLIICQFCVINCISPIMPDSLSGSSGPKIGVVAQVIRCSAGFP